MAAEQGYSCKARRFFASPPMSKLPDGFRSNAHTALGGILPGEEMKQSRSDSSVIIANKTPSGNTLVVAFGTTTVCEAAVTQSKERKKTIE